MKKLLFLWVFMVVVIISSTAFAGEVKMQVGQEGPAVAVKVNNVPTEVLVDEVTAPYVDEIAQAVRHPGVSVPLEVSEEIKRGFLYLTITKTPVRSIVYLPTQRRVISTSANRIAGVETKSHPFGIFWTVSILAMIMAIISFLRGGRVFSAAIFASFVAIAFAVVVAVAIAIATFATAIAVAAAVAVAVAVAFAPVDANRRSSFVCVGAYFFFMASSMAGFLWG